MVHVCGTAAAVERQGAGLPSHCSLTRSSRSPPPPALQNNNQYNKKRKRAMSEKGRERARLAPCPDDAGKALTRAAA